MGEHCGTCGSRLCGHGNCPECNPCNHCDGGDRHDKYFGEPEGGDGMQWEHMDLDGCAGGVQ